MPLTLEVRCRVHTETRRKHRPLLRRESLLYALALPEVEPALVALGIGVQTGIQCAVAIAELAQHPLGDIARGIGEQTLTGRRGAFRVQTQQLRVVVQHFLEMRELPALID